MLIPKKVHITWKSKDILESTSPLILNGVRNIKELNSDWVIEISDDQEVIDYLKNYLTNEDMSLIENATFAEKSDMWRLLKMFYEGGLYIDIDRFFNKKLSDIIKDDVKCIIPICANNDFSQDIMISVPGCPIHKHTLNLILQRRKLGYTNTYLLGPQTYMHAITELLTGSMINTNPGTEAFNNLFNVIKQSSFLDTFVENPPYNTFVFSLDKENFNYGDRQLDDWQLIKEDFYARYNVKHWTGLW
jgi:mannosyltransferase OCH1-like enzyme